MVGALLRSASGLAALAVLAASILAGCASEPRVMHLDGNGAGSPRLWPALQTEELPRYRYVGELTGDANFATPDERRGSVGTVVSWLVGLTERDAAPNVLQRPQSGIVDGAGRIYVTDVSRKAVFVFDEPGGKLDVWEDAERGTPFMAPIGVALGADATVLVSDAALGRVFRFDAAGRPLGTFGGGVLRRPTGIARDAARNRIYVADTHAHDIKVFDDAGNLVATWGRRGDGAGEFNYPTHLAFAHDTLYVTDVMNSRIQGLAPDGHALFAYGERGLYVGNLVRPKGVATDTDGNIYVIESLYDTLLVLDAQGQLLLSIGGTGKDPGKFYLPAGVWTDARNRIFVADMFNGRVSIFQFLGGS